MSKKTETKKTVRVLLLKRTDDTESKIEVPEDAKLTFGPAVPYAPKSGTFHSEGKGYALRVYRGTKENLLACFTGVVEFRDMMIPLHKAVIREAGKTLWKSDEEGYSTSTEVSRERFLIPEAFTPNKESK